MKTIGIDLGTTNSCVYYLDDEGRPVLATDRLGRKIFPSAVWCAGAGQEVVVGHAAKSRLGQQPPPVVAVKRKLGTTARVLLAGAEVSPVEVSAHVLGYAKRLVEEATGDRVGGAVVTVPAYFDAAPKRDTYEAAVAALFGGDAAAARGRLELQLEPEAAAYAYTLEDPAERLRILVYDLGGGTFDVTLLDKSPEGGLSVLKFGGDPHLGGDNVDDRVAAWVLYLLRGGRADALDRLLAPGRYPEEERYTLLQQLLTHDADQLARSLRPEDRDLRVDARQLYALDLDIRRPADLPRIQQVKRLAEQAKIDLTTSTEASLSKQGAFEDQQGNLVDIDLTLSRGDFERLVGDMVARTIEETRRVLAESGLGAEQVDRIVLVGGSTRMPMVAQELERAFGRPLQLADPDLIVARGAALRARELSAPAAADGRLTIEAPRQTPERSVAVKGRLSERLDGHRAYLFRDGRDVAEAPVEGDRFLLAGVPLEPETENRFHLEVADGEDRIFAATEVVVRHSAGALASTGSLSTKITKAIRSRGVHGFGELFGEGEVLPARKVVPCYRASQGDRISIEFYEGERWLTDLVIDVDPSLPVGARIDVDLTLDKDYSCQATATVLTTRASASVAFQISRAEIPSQEVMDRDLQGVMDEIENDLGQVRDRDRRAGFAQRVRRLRADYAKAGRALDTDLHHLYSLVGELRKVLIEVRAAHDLLEPPLETCRQLVRVVRGLAERLEPSHALAKADVQAKIGALERAGEGAWERQDAATWRSVFAELEKVKEDLETALRPPDAGARNFPPELIQREVLKLVDRVRAKAAESGRGQEVEEQLRRIERAVRDVDPRGGDAARNALIQIVQDQLNPLDHRLERAARDGGPAGGSGERRPDVDWMR